LSELTLRNQQGRWLVRQTRNHVRYGTVVKVYREIDGDWSLSWPGGGCPKRLADAQKFAGTLLGLKPNEFAGCLYLSQHAVHTLIEGLPSEKMLYIAHLFGLDVYDEVLAALTGQLKLLTAKLHVIDDLERQLEISTVTRDDLHDPNRLWLTERLVEVTRRNAETIDRLEGEIQTAHSGAQEAERRAQLEARLVGRDVDVGPWDAKLARLSVGEQTVREQLAHARQRERLTAALAKLPDVPDRDYEALLEAAERDVEAARTALTQARKRAELTDQYHATDDPETLVALVEELNGTVASLESSRDDTAERAHRMQRLLDELCDGECPTCRRPMDADLMRETVTLWRREIDDIEARLKKMRRGFEKAKLRLRDAQAMAKIAEQIAALPDLVVESVQQRFTDATDRLAAIEHDIEVVRKRRQFDEQLAELPETPAVEILSDKQDLMAARRVEYDRQRDAVIEAREWRRLADQLTDRSTSVLRRHADRATTIRDEIVAVDHEVRERLAIERQLLDRYNTTVTQTEQLTQRIAAFAEDRRRAQTLRYAIDSVKKVRRRRLHEVVQGIREILPRYAGTMFAHEPNTTFVVDEDGESLELRARRVVDVGGVREVMTIPVKGFSGGEKQRLSVALLFTLHRLLDPTKRPDLLVLDEVDRGLDERGVASLMSLVREVRDQYGTVVMTSHREQISGATFDSVWQVTKTNEVSELTR
jgi:DNA repair exonuclease SbcCD ATPase subunit